MDEKKIRFVLSTIPTILLVVCIVAAFATHGWNVRTTVFSEDPRKTVERLLPFEFDAETEFLEVKGIELAEGGNKLAIEVVIHSPLNVPMTIEELSAEVVVGNSTSTISLPGKVEIPAKGSSSIKLEGSLPKAGMPSEAEPKFRNMKMKLDITGLKLEVFM